MKTSMKRFQTEYRLLAVSVVNNVYRGIKVNVENFIE